MSLRGNPAVLYLWGVGARTRGFAAPAFAGCAPCAGGGCAASRCSSRPERPLRSGLYSPWWARR